MKIFTHDTHEKYTFLTLSKKKRVGNFQVREQNDSYSRHIRVQAHAYTHLRPKYSLSVSWIHVQFLNSNTFQCWPLKMKRFITTKSSNMQYASMAMQCIPCLSLITLATQVQCCISMMPFRRKCVVDVICMHLSYYFSYQKIFIVVISVFGICKIRELFLLKVRLRDKFHFLTSHSFYSRENWYILVVIMRSPSTHSWSCRYFVFGWRLFCHLIFKLSYLFFLLYSLQSQISSFFSNVSIAFSFYRKVFIVWILSVWRNIHAMCETT